MPMSGRVGLVVAGAGARGAYEAGALSALLPRMAETGASPSVLVGTSAGALNVIAWASVAHLPPHEAARALTGLWGSVRLRDVARVERSLAVGALEYGGQLLGLPTRLPSLLDTSRLLNTLMRLVDWDQVRENIQSGPIDVLAVAATSTATGGTVVFVQKKPSVPLPPRDQNRNITYVETEVTPLHALASAAVPVFFRPVSVPTPEPWAGWYIDGGLRLNAPLKPAIDFGCDRLGVVSTQSMIWPDGPPASQPDAASQPDVFGQAALALQVQLADRMIEDLHRLQSINLLVREQPDLARYRHIDVQFAGPSPARAHDLGTLANCVFHRNYSGIRASRDRSLWLLNRLIGGAAASHGDLLSFLFFDSAFTSPAADLGHQQASAQLG
jgi:NTE family protein